MHFRLEDPGAGARVFKAFAKENDAFEIRALSVGGQLLPAEQIDALATATNSRPSVVDVDVSDASSSNEIGTYIQRRPGSKLPESCRLSRTKSNKKLLN